MTSPFSPYQPPAADALLRPNGEGDPATSRRATLWQRWAAAFFDGLLSMVVLLPLEYKAGFFAGFPTAVRPMTFAQSALWGAISFIIWVAIHGYSLSKSAQTIGKRIMGIRIENRADGAPTPFAKIAFVRFLPITLLSLIPKVGPFLGVLDVLFIFRANRRCIHDQLADTVVMKVE